MAVRITGGFLKDNSKPPRQTQICRGGQIFYKAFDHLQGKHYLVRDNSPPETRYDIPLWHRIQEPEAMSVLLISFTMVALGIRILWERGRRASFGCFPLSRRRNCCPGRPLLPAAPL
mgnify:CR=1 FL=1